MTEQKRRRLYEQARVEYTSLGQRLQTLAAHPGGPSTERRMAELQKQRTEWYAKLKELTHG